MPTCNKFILFSGEEYTDDVREAWTPVFDYVTSRLRYGYLLYMEDKENENDVNDNEVDTADHITSLGTSDS